MIACGSRVKTQEVALHAASRTGAAPLDNCDRHSRPRNLRHGCNTRGRFCAMTQSDPTSRRPWPVDGPGRHRRCPCQRRHHRTAADHGDRRSRAAATLDHRRSGASRPAATAAGGSQRPPPPAPRPAPPPPPARQRQRPGRPAPPPADPNAPPPPATLTNAPPPRQLIPTPPPRRPACPAQVRRSGTPASGASPEAGRIENASGGFSYVLLPAGWEGRRCPSG